MGVFEILAVIGVALWIAGLAWFFFSDVVHSAQRHHVHVPHPHLRHAHHEPRRRRFNRRQR